MQNSNKEIWIKTGYEIFALSGKTELKIEPIAKLVGKSKSSFYHLFADLDLFIEYLLNYHIEQSLIIAEKEKNVSSIEPDLINILVEHRLDLLFNRQLRINQHISGFNDTLKESNRIIGDVFKMAWVKEINLQLSPKQIESIFSLAIENFYLQINADNLNYKWLSGYFNNLKSISNNFIVR
jgi:AcrR family transcriptional regulator